MNTIASCICYSGLFHGVLPGLLFGLPIALPFVLVAWLCMGDFHAVVFMHAFNWKWNAFCPSGVVFVLHILLWGRLCPRPESGTLAVKRPATWALPLCFDLVTFERILLHVRIFGIAGIVCCLRLAKLPGFRALHPFLHTVGDRERLQWSLLCSSKFHSRSQPSAHTQLPPAMWGLRNPR